MNLYAYVGNDPLNATDPTGMCTGSRIENGDGTCASNGGNSTGVFGSAQGMKTWKLDRTEIAHPETGETTTVGALLDEVGERTLGEREWNDNRAATRQMFAQLKTIFFGSAGSASYYLGGTYATGGYVDVETDERGEFITVGGAVGMMIAGEVFIGGINQSSDSLSGMAIFIEGAYSAFGGSGFAGVSGFQIVNTPIAPYRAVLGKPNGTVGVTIGLGLGVGAQVGISNTWTRPYEKK